MPSWATLQNCCAITSWFLQIQTQPQSTSCCLVYRCFSTQHSTQAQCPNHGKLHWSRQSSRGAMLQTQLTTGQLQWVSLSVGCMLASWFSVNAWSSIWSSEASDLPLRQATGQGTAPSIRYLCCSTSLTNTDAASLHYISALWASNLHMTACSGSCCGTCFADWGYKAVSINYRYRFCCTTRTGIWLFGKPASAANPH